MRELTCIVCPNGCSICIDQDAQPWKITGNACPRGAGFAREELTHPMRTVCSTVRTVVPRQPRLSVRTRGEVPLDRVMDVMAAINHYTVEGEVHIGDVLISNVAGTGVPLIATSDTVEKGERDDGESIRSGNRLRDTERPGSAV